MGCSPWGRTESDTTEETELARTQLWKGAVVGDLMQIFGGLDSIYLSSEISSTCSRNAVGSEKSSTAGLT